MKLRRLLEENKLGEALIAKVGAVLPANGMKVDTGIALRLFSAESTPTDNRGCSPSAGASDSKYQEQHCYGLRSLKTWLNLRTDWEISSGVNAANPMSHPPRLGGE
jgi:hypothetical protein